MIQFLTVKEIAKALQCSEVWIYKLAHEGKIPFYRIEKALRFDPQEIETWLQSKKGVVWYRDKRIRGSNEGVNAG